MLYKFKVFCGISQNNLTLKTTLNIFKFYSANILIVIKETVH